jgi:hypothetical protein
MVMKITVSYRAGKNEGYEQVITIEDYVDYAYFKALFDALLEMHLDFKMERFKRVEE